MVRWSFEDTKGNIRTLELPCLYVPSIHQRLLSTSSLMKQYPKESISISDGKMVLSGSENTASIQVETDFGNNLPTSTLIDLKLATIETNKMKSLVSVVAIENQNLSEPEKELLKWHQRLAHIDCNKVKFLFRTGVLAKGDASRR